MLNNKFTFASLLLSLPVFLFLTSTVSAAAPDGYGPWADKVINTKQGMMKNGSPVPAIRSDASSALGVAENDTVEGHFYSLGFGGKITLGFKNGIKNGVVVEATNPNYPTEKAKVEVSPDKWHWFEAGSITSDGSVNIPRRAGCIHYVRVTDVSNAAEFPDETADGYDVDGVKGEGEKCHVKNQHSWHKFWNKWAKKWEWKKDDNGDKWSATYSERQVEEIDRGE